MALILGRAALEGVLKMRDTIDLLSDALAHEAVGRTFVSPKSVTDFEGGSMRVLVAADYISGYMVTKAYNLAKQETGARFVVSLYRLSDGELLALLDGRLITDLRTGAASGVMARRVPIAGPVRIGIIGSGNQARSQLESLATVYAVESVAVFSPTIANREDFANRMSEMLGIRVEAVDSAEAAVRDRQVVASASSARLAEPILKGEWLSGCRLLCAVGNTRPNFAEADVACFADSGLVVVDSLHAIEEAGDLRQAVAAGAMPPHKRATLADLVMGRIPVPAGRVAFKSVGTALQDLALATRYYELLADREGLLSSPDLGIM